MIVSSKHSVYFVNNKLNYIIVLIIPLFITISCSSKKSSSKDTIPLPKALIEYNQIDTLNIKQEAKNLVILGSSYQMMDRHAEAILEFQQAIRLDSSASIFFAIGKSYYELGKFNLSIEYLQKSIELNKQFIPAWELLIEVYIMNFDLSKAIETVVQLLRIDNSRGNRIILARLYEFDDTDKAVAIYEKLIADRFDVSLMKRLIELYKQNNQDEEYIVAVKRLYEEDKTDPEIVFELLEYYFRENQFDEVDKLIEDIDNNLVNDELAIFYRAINSVYLYTDIDPKHIKTLLTKIDNRFYFNWRLNLDMGTLCLKIDDKEQANLLFDRALKFTDEFQATMYVAYQYFSVQYYKKCADILEKFELEHPDSINVKIFLADVYDKLGNTDGSLSKLIESFELDSTNLEVLAQLANYYEKVGLIDESIATYESALRLDRSNPLINNNYAYMLSNLGQELDKALKMSNLAISVEPDNAAYLDTYGWIMFKLGDLEKAEKYIKKALEYEQIAELYEHLGDVYDAMNRTEDALKNWQKAKELEPNHKGIDERIEKYK